MIFTLTYSSAKLPPCKVEINTLEELLELKEKAGTELVLADGYWDNHHIVDDPHVIEIYDSYRE